MQSHRRFMLSLLVAALPSMVVSASGCHTDNADVDPSERNAVAERDLAEGRRVEFALEPGAAQPDELEAAVRHLETLADIGAAKASVTVGDGDATIVSVELWGADFPADDAIASAMREQFPFLKDAIISVSALEDTNAPPAIDRGTKDEDPEQARQRIIAELRANGVEGDIVVDVVDSPSGERSIEVHVEQHKDVQQDAPAEDGEPEPELEQAPF